MRVPRQTLSTMVTKLFPGSGKVWTVPARICVNESSTAKPGAAGRPSPAIFKDKLFCVFRKLNCRIAIIHTEDKHSGKGQTNIGLESKGYSTVKSSLVSRNLGARTRYLVLSLLPSHLYSTQLYWQQGAANRAVYDGAYWVMRGMDLGIYSLPLSSDTIWYNDFTIFSGDATQGAPASCLCFRHQAADLSMECQ